MRGRPVPCMVKCGPRHACAPFGPRAREVRHCTRGFSPMVAKPRQRELEIEHTPAPAPQTARRAGVRHQKQPKGTPPYAGPAIIGALGLCVVLAFLAAGGRSLTKRTAQAVPKAESMPEEPAPPE